MAQSFWPGQTFRPRTDFRTGEAEVFRQLGNLAATGGDVAVKIYVQQAQDQFSTAQIQTKQAETDYAALLSKELDETKYPDMLKKHESAVKKFRPGNPLAAHDFDNYVATKSIEWGKSNVKAAEDRLISKWEIKFDELEKDFIETGDETIFLDHASKGWEVHGQDQAEILRQVEEARRLAERRKAENVALSSPEEFLRKVKGNKIEGFPLLTPGDVQDIRNTAKGEIAFRRSQEDAALSSFYTDISQKAEQGMPFGELRDSIRNQPGLTVEEREKAMNVARSAYRTWDDGGTKENPWKTTQDQGALLDVQIMISSGQPVTEMDIIRAQYAQPNKGPLFSNPDRDRLFTQLPDNDQKPELKTPSAKLNQEHVKTLFSTEEYEAEVGGRKVTRKRIPFERLGEYQSKLNEVNALISAYKDNPVRAQKEIEESLTGLREENVKEWFDRWYWKFTTPGLLWRAGKGVEDIRKDLFKERTEKESPHPEYPDAYFVNGEWRVTKGGQEYRIE